MKSKFFQKDITPPFRKPWVSYEKDPFAKVKASKKAGKKK